MKPVLYDEQLKGKQTGSLYGNFIAHFACDKILKLVLLSEEFYRVTIFFYLLLYSICLMEFILNLKFELF